MTKMATSFMSDNKTDIEDTINSVFKKILPKQYCKFHMIIKSMQSCTIETDLKPMIEVFDIREEEFMLQMAIAIKKNDDSYTQATLVKVIKDFSLSIKGEEAKKEVNIVIHSLL